MPLLTHKVTHVVGERSVIWFLVNHRSRWHQGYTPDLLNLQLVSIIYLLPREFSDGFFEWRHQAISRADERFACYWVVGRKLTASMSSILEKLGIPLSVEAVRYGGDSPPYEANGGKPRKRVKNYGGSPQPSNPTHNAKFVVASWYADMLTLYEERERWRGRKRNPGQHEPYMLSEMWQQLDGRAERLRSAFGLDLTLYSIGSA